MDKTMILIAAAGVIAIASCRYISVEPSYEGDGTFLQCELDTSIPQGYEGKVAKDSDVPGTDADIFWEAGDYSNTVDVTWQGATAAVNTQYSGVEVTIDGADVTLDFASKGGANAQVTLSGSSDNGSITIISDSRLKLSLAGVQLSSKDSPAVIFRGSESQPVFSAAKKIVSIREANAAADPDVLSIADDAPASFTGSIPEFALMRGKSGSEEAATLFVDCPTGKSNSISDGNDYEGMDEDMEGALYCEGPVIFSGKGTLKVKGNCLHGISTASWMLTRPGSTIIIEDAVYAGINVAGSEKTDTQGDELGLAIMGGYIFSRISNKGGAAILCGTNIKIYGGEAELYTTGDSEFIPDLLFIRQSTALEAGQDISIYDGTVKAKSCGLGGRSIRAYRNYAQYDGEVLATTTGKYYKYHNLIGEARAVEAGKHILLDAGKLDAGSTYTYTYSNAIKSGKKLTVNDAEAYAYSYDDAVRVQDLEVNGGYLFSFSAGANAINSDNEIVINDGLVEAGAMDAAFRNGGGFHIEGGTLLGIYTVTAAPSGYEQSYGTYSSGISGNTGDIVSVLDGNRTVFSFKIPRSENDTRVIYSSDDEGMDSTLEIYKWGTLSGEESRHRILINGGTFTGGYYVDTLLRVVNN